MVNTCGPATSSPRGSAIPIEVMPKPKDLERVMVGRLELLSPGPGSFIGRSAGKAFLASTKAARAVTATRVAPGSDGQVVRAASVARSER